MADEIQIIVPATADPIDQLDGALVTLTEQIAKIDPDAAAHGFLGGEFGYGAKFENEVFMMHPYCWCEQKDCLWCTIWLSNEEDCTEEAANAHRKAQENEIRARYGDWAAAYPQAPHFWHKASGLQVRWYKWIGRDVEVHGADGLGLSKIFNECFASLGPVRKAGAA